MRITLFLLIYVNVGLWAQTDTSYIELLPRDKTIQLHTTFKDFSLTEEIDGKETVAFRNHNWSSGFYFKWGLYELFVAIPTKAFDNYTEQSDKSFGTGFGLNFYPGKVHYNYDFKYIQGFESFSEVWEDKLKTLTENNFFIFNRLNIHYVMNSDQFSLRSALRFNDRQKKSAGSIIIGLPLSYHLATLSVGGELEDHYYSRSAAGLMAGYGYTFVAGQWATSLILKGGYDIRYSSYLDWTEITLVPAYNVIASSVYNWKKNFVGLSYNTYPERDNSEMFRVNIVNWKLRLYAGKRFY